MWLTAVDGQIDRREQKSLGPAEFLLLHLLIFSKQWRWGRERGEKIQEKQKKK